MLALDLGHLEPSYVDCEGTDKDAEDNERSRYGKLIRPELSSLVG
jgi:hypothetical protein